LRRSGFFACGEKGEKGTQLFGVVEEDAVAVTQMLRFVAGHCYLAGQYQVARILLRIFVAILFLISSVICSV